MSVKLTVLLYLTVLQHIMEQQDIKNKKNSKSRKKRRQNNEEEEDEGEFMVERVICTDKSGKHAYRHEKT